MTPAATPQDAAHRALARQLRLARHGRSMLFPFIGRSRRFELWQHYPAHDAVDATGRWQFYFHAHASGGADAPRHPQEHGHIHLFRRSPQGRLSHLTGLSLDARGLPLAWFATNQWVTAEHWMPASALGRGLSNIELQLRGPLAGAALWLSDMVRFYAAPLRRMLQERDAALTRHCEKHKRSAQQAWSDRRIAVWSALPIHWPHDALNTALAN